MVLAHLACRDSTLAIGKGEIGRIDRRHDIELEQRRNGLDRRLAQDQDGFCDPALSKLNAFTNRRHGKHVGTGRIHDFGALDGTMAIGIGLHYAAQSLTLIEQILVSPRVAAKRPSVNLNPGPARQIGFIHD